MIKTIAIVVVVALGALLLYAATQPDTFSVQRSASIKAPADKNMDRMIGQHFETGLADLKSLAERA